MKHVDEFLAHAVRMEQEAALRFDELAETMASFGNGDVAAFFRKMAEFSRLHLKDARARAGYHDTSLDESAFGSAPSPETASWEGVDPLMAVGQALALALESERAGHAFYAGYLDDPDPKIRAMAEEFTAEEAEHVAELEKWLERHNAAAQA